MNVRSREGIMQLEIDVEEIGGMEDKPGRRVVQLSSTAGSRALLRDSILKRSTAIRKRKRRATYTYMNREIDSIHVNRDTAHARCVIRTDYHGTCHPTLSLVISWCVGVCGVPVTRPKTKRWLPAKEASMGIT